MTLEGRLTIDMNEIKQALADYISRYKGIKIAADDVKLYPSANTGWSVVAYVDVPVEIKSDKAA